MSYRRILVQTGPRASDTPRLELAAALARRSDAALVGVFVAPPPVGSILVPGADMAAPPPQISLSALEAEQATAVRQELELSTDALRAAARPHGLEPAFETVADDPAALARLARTADLTVTPAPDDPGAAAAAAPDVVALESGGPILIVPQAWTPGPVGRRVLVAWDGSAEAARALKDARPILRQAESVDVLIVDADPASLHAETVVPAYLAAHDCQARALRISSVDQPVGEVLLREAHRLEADMIVMGLYGHSRLREVMLGGVSRHLLRHARLPLFVSH